MDMKEAHDAGINAIIKEAEEIDWIKALFGNGIGSAQQLFEAQMRAYLDASGMVLVPKHMTSEMVKNVQMYSEMGAYVTSEWAGAYDVMDEYWAKLLECTPNPFQTPEESREKK